MRYTLFFILVLTTVLVSCKSGKGGKGGDDPGIEQIDTVPMLVQQVHQCSRLYTAEYKVHKIVTYDDKKKLSGKLLGKDYSINLPVGNRKVAIPINATLKAYIDMSDISFDDVHLDGDKIEIVLPKPHVVMTSSSIDHDGVKQYVALLRSSFSDEELSSYEKQGRKAIIADIPNLGILEMAKESAARQLIPMIERMGFREENITIIFVADSTSSSTSKKGGIAWVLD